MADNLYRIKAVSPNELVYLLNHRKANIELFEKGMKQKGIKAILCPTSIHAAVKNEHVFDVGMIPDYNMIWNYYNYPCGVVPITKVREDELEYSDDYNDSYTVLIKDDIKGSEGLPVGV